MNRMTLTIALAAGVASGACREAAMQPDLGDPAAAVAINTASSSAILTQSFDMPISAFTRVTFASCASPRGPSIALDTRLDMDGLSTQVALQGETAPGEAVATFEVVSTGADIDLPRQSDRAGVGADPLVWIQFETNDGTELSPELPLGRCSQLTAARDLVVDYETLAQATAEIAVRQCGSQLGPLVSVAGALALQSGLVGEIIVRDDLPPAGTSPAVGADAVLHVLIYEPGYQISFQRQQLRTDVEGDPVITAAFLDGQGTLVAAPETLGTCEDLTPAVGG